MCKSAYVRDLRVRLVYKSYNVTVTSVVPEAPEKAESPVQNCFLRRAVVYVTV